MLVFQVQIFRDFCAESGKSFDETETVWQSVGASALVLRGTELILRPRSTCPRSNGYKWEREPSSQRIHPRKEKHELPGVLRVRITPDQESVCENEQQRLKRRSPDADSRFRTHRHKVVSAQQKENMKKWNQTFIMFGYPWEFTRKSQSVLSDCLPFREGRFSASNFVTIACRPQTCRKLRIQRDNRIK